MGFLYNPPMARIDRREFIQAGASFLSGVLFNEARITVTNDIPNNIDSYRNGFGENLPGSVLKSVALSGAAVWIGISSLLLGIFSSVDDSKNLSENDRRFLLRIGASTVLTIGYFYSGVHTPSYVRAERFNIKIVGPL